MNGAAAAAADPVQSAAPIRRETVSTRVTAGVIVVASLSVLGVGAWAFHHPPPPAAPSAPAPAAAVGHQVVVASSGGVNYRVDVPVGPSAPDVSNGVVSKYASAREFDVVHIPSAGPADLPTMLSTFSSGWPTTNLRTGTTKNGASLAFDLTTDTNLTHGVLVDAGGNGVFLLAVKAPKGSTLTAVDRSALARAVNTLTVGS